MMHCGKMPYSTCLTLVGMRVNYGCALGPFPAYWDNAEVALRYWLSLAATKKKAGPARYPAFSFFWIVFVLGFLDLDLFLTFL